MNLNDQRKTSTMKKVLFTALAVFALLIGSYRFVCYTDIEPVASWRTLYIETAMSTMTHTWLARIFPQDVIDGVMAGVEERFIENKVEGTPPEDAFSVQAEAPAVPEEPEEPEPDPEQAAWDEFTALFPDVAREDVEALGVTWQDLSGLDLEEPEGLKTVQGDRVFALNVPERILILEIKSGSYAGKLAIANGPERTVLAKNRLNGRGSTVTELCEKNDAILGVNASGFYDPSGHGAGDVPVGLVISNGEKFGEAKDQRYQLAGLDYDNVFRMGYGLDLDSMRDAMQFYPITVMEGKNVVDGSFGMGVQPRTLVGQRSDGAMMFLVIDGRQVGHSLGIDISKCADIMIQYGCYSAMNMDGGSSSSMTYNGKMITRTSSPMKAGRYLPDAWVVKHMPAAVESDGEA